MTTLTPTQYHALLVEDALSDFYRTRTDALLNNRPLPSQEDTAAQVPIGLDEHQRKAFYLALAARRSAPVDQRGTVQACARQAMELVSPVQLANNAPEAKRLFFATKYSEASELPNGEFVGLKVRS